MKKDWSQLDCYCGNGCDSQLECMFWHYLRKTPKSEDGATPQKRFENFRVDAFIEDSGKAIVVELDGKAFHNAERDRKRDGVILKYVDAIIRIPFSAMMYHQDATFAVLAGWFQRFDRGPGMATPFYQLVNELDEVKKGDKPGWSYQNYLEMIEPWYEIWHVEGNVGWVGSPKAILNGWDILPIVLYQ